jgi:Sulfotransferase family
MMLGPKVRFQLYRMGGVLGSLGLFGKLHPPLLVVGSPNSGTRVLAKAIAVHPDIVDQSEARVLWDRDFHGRNNDTQKEAGDVRPADVSRLRGIFSYYQWASGKRLVMNRHPENSLRLHFMKAIFPEARLVHIVRDGRAAVCSNYLSAQHKKNRPKYPFGGYIRPPGWRDWLSRPVLEQLAFMWNTAVLYASREGRKYGEDYLEIRYEDLPKDAPSIISAVWKWIGLAPSEDLLSRMPVFENRNYKWKESLSNEEVATIERLAKEGLQEFGYLPRGGN